MAGGLAVLCTVACPAFAGEAPPATYTPTAMPVASPSPPCLAGAELTFDVMITPAQPWVGEEVLIDVAVRTTTGPAFVPVYSLLGTAPYLDGEVDPRPFPHLMSRFDVHHVIYQLRALQAGMAQLRFSAYYEECSDCNCRIFSFIPEPIVADMRIEIDAGIEPTAPTATPSATDTPTITPSPPVLCAGDCDTNGQVTVDELVRGVNIALGIRLLSDCPSFDANGDNEVTIEELVAVILRVLNGCQTVSLRANRVPTVPTWQTTSFTVNNECRT